jgi:hypothetical protein
MHPNTTKRNKSWIWVQWGGSGASLAKTSDTTSWHELLHYLHQFSPFCTEFTTVTSNPKCTQTLRNTTKDEFRVQWGGLGAFVVKNIQRDFVARTFALIAPFQLILHRVSCSNKMVPNAPKHYETQKKLSFGSNGVDQVHSLRKHPMQLRGMNFCINWTSSAHFALSLLS